MTETKDLLKSIDQRLEMLVRLHIEEKLEDLDTNLEKIKILHQAGFSDQEIADIIDTTSGSVRGSKSTLRERGEIDD